MYLSGNRTASGNPGTQQDSHKGDPPDEEQINYIIYLYDEGGDEVLSLGVYGNEVWSEMGQLDNEEEICQWMENCRK